MSIILDKFGKPYASDGSPVIVRDVEPECCPLCKGPVKKLECVRKYSNGRSERRPELDRWECGCGWNSSL